MISGSTGIFLGLSECDIVKSVVNHGIVFFQNVFSYLKKCFYCISRFGL